MKNYHLYLFTQDGCPPCQRVKEHIAHLPEAQQDEIDIVPMKGADGMHHARN